MSEPSLFARDPNPEICWCWFSVELQAWGWAYTTKRDALAAHWKNPEGATQQRTWRGLTAAAHKTLAARKKRGNQGRRAIE